MAAWKAHRDHIVASDPRACAASGGVRWGILTRPSLLATVSALALATASTHADARSLRDRASSPSAAAAAAAGAAQIEASRAAREAADSLKRATQAIQAMQATQKASRDAARLRLGTMPNAVPNGLRPGGLQIGSGVVKPDGSIDTSLWQGANLPTEAPNGGQTKVTVTQTQQKAILTWRSFNVGGNTELYFDQRAGGADASKWIALNRVLDPSGVPSKILGSIKADGQVYIINRNGIVFGGASQVNVGALVASSLRLTDEQFLAGINNPLRVNDPNSSGNDWGLPQFGEYTTATGAGAYYTPSSIPGDVTVEAGAQLKTADGGKMMLFAPKVTNAGELSAKNGQVILAAGEQVWLATDTTGTRGLNVAVSAPAPRLFNISQLGGALGLGQVFGTFPIEVRDAILPLMEARAASVGYKVTNSGTIHSERGNITLQSREISQNGILTATSGLEASEGSIRLRAWGQGMMGYSASMEGPALISWSAGKLTVGADSVISVTPDLTERTEIEASSVTARYKPGWVELRGKLIDIQSRASVVVPSGHISVVANAVPVAMLYSPAAGPYSEPVQGEPGTNDGSRIYVDSDAYLGTAGLHDMLVAMARNFVEAELRINELRDSPLYKGSWLSGTKVIVDRRRMGRFEAGPMSGVEWIAGDPGAWIGTPLADVTAWVGIGKTDLAELSAKAGTITLKSSGSVITRAGSLLDVSGGSVRYAGVGKNTTKLRGADGRVYDIGDATSDMVYVGLAQGFSRRHVLLGGATITETWTSPLRRSRPELGYTEGRDAGLIRIFGAEAMVLDGTYWGGVLAGERQAENGNLPIAGTLKIGGGSDADRGWTPSNLVVTETPQTLPESFAADAVIGADYYSGGRKTVWLSADTLAASGMEKLDLFVTGSFSLKTGTTLELDPGTTFSVGANGPANGAIAYNIDGTIRTAGGTVSFGTQGTGLGSVKLGANAVIDVAGVWQNDLIDGVAAIAPTIKGGAITIQAGTTTAVRGAVLDVSGGGWVRRQGAIGVKTGDAGSITVGFIDGASMQNLDLRAFSAASGGSLRVETASSVQLGGDTPTDSSILHIPGSLYAERGFRSVAILSQANIVVPKDVTITQLPYSVSLAAGVLNAASGSKIADIGTIGTLPDRLRAERLPTSITLETTGGNIAVEAGAHVRTDLGGRIEIKAGSPSSMANATIRGTLEAPAGSIVLNASDTTRLADGGQLLARGAAVIFADALGRRAGEVRPGGRVTLSAGGLVALDIGSLVDVSGTSGVVDTIGGESIAVASDGGTITLNSGNRVGAAVSGSFVAQAGGLGASGGNLIVSEAALSTQGNKITLPSYVYYVHPVTGVVTRAQLTTTFDFDIRDEYGTTPIRITNAMATALTSMPIVVSEGVSIVDGPAPAVGGAGRPVWEVNPIIDRRIIELINRNLWNGTGSGTSAVMTTKIVIPNQITLATRISSQSIADGGFANVSFSAPNGFSVKGGVNLNLNGKLGISAPYISNAAGGGSARLAASYLSLTGTGTTAPAMPSGANGTLTLAGTVVDLLRNTYIRGYSETVIEAGDLRLTAPLQTTGLPVPTVLLDVQGALTLKAGQVYPTTGARATIKSNTSIAVERNGNMSPPLSAGGSLTLDAPVIRQSGVLRAPFGEIILKAGTRLTLGAGSITSVSGAGLLVPYGVLSNGEHWIDPTELTDFANPSNNYLTSAPEKRISLEAPIVDAAAGSMIDISGGGDLYAREFVPGPGGSRDILALAGSYAVIPGFVGLTPTGTAGERVWLAGGNGLAAGWYTLLPASYAALPGAYLISSSGTGMTTPLPRSVALTDGSVLMTGRRANGMMGTEDQLFSSWRVMNGAQLRRYSEYNEANANAFFASDEFKLTQYRVTGQTIVTPRLPSDGGAVVLKATQELILKGSLESHPAAGGRGGLVDIAGTKIAVLGTGEDGSALRAGGYLILDAGALTNFGASSLLIGGMRSSDPLGLKLAVTASDIVVRNGEGSALTGPEIILAASGLINIGAGSVILSEGEIAGASSDLIMTPVGTSDYGALVRVSNGDAVRVIRQNVTTATGGTVTIGANARVVGGQSLLIDATRNTELAGTALLSGKSLSVASGRIGFGGGNVGLVLSLDTLTRLANAEALVLRSYSSVDFYAAIDFGGVGLASVTLDAAGLAGYGASNIAISGKRIVLENSGGGTAQAGTGSGMLTLTADELVLGRGAKTVSGFGAVELRGRQKIVGEGSGALNTGNAALSLVTPLLTGRGGSAQSIVSNAALVLTNPSSTPVTDVEASLGARLGLIGATVNIGGQIAALGGAVDITATSGDAVIGNGAIIDVGGLARQFFDVEDYADAGRIALAAVGGDVLVNTGATLNLAAHARGGNAGTLAASSDGGTVVLAGAIAAHAGPGAKGGSFVFDGATLDYATMNDRLNAAGFTRSRQFRVRTGNVLVSGSTSVEDFKLSADTGKVTIAGAIDARSTYGGRIAITGGNGLVMASTASLRAAATDAELGSGRVALEAAGGRLAINGGTIDVSGGEGGKVRFRARRTAGHDEIAADALSATILGARSTVLEGVSVYDSATTGGVKAQAIADANTFASNAGTIAARLGLGGGIAIMSGIEIRSTGDLTVNGDWNLFADFALRREGTLTLRAAGNLIVNGHISDGFNAADRSGVLQDAASWDLRLVGGADLTAADALATVPLPDLATGSGNIKIGDGSAGKLVRTGTGDIQLRAARDIDLAHVQSVVYTAGRRDMQTWSDFTAPANATYGIGGGHLSLSAGGNVSAALPTNQTDYQLFTEWLRRRAQFVAPEYTYVAGQQATWWIDYGRFQQGVGALGGGNVSVEAGGDLGNLLVALPSNARVRGGRTSGEQKSLEIRNGGLMAVEVGGAIRGGQYYAGRGAGVITAAELGIGRMVTRTPPDGSGQSQFSVSPVLGLGDASLTVQTTGTMRIQTIFDPLMMSPWRAYDPITNVSGISGYTDRTSLALKSIGGNVELVNNGSYLVGGFTQSTAADVNLYQYSRGASNLYPALTKAVALDGSIDILGQLAMQPGTTTNLELLAQNDINLRQAPYYFLESGQILMSRGGPTDRYTPFRPWQTVGTPGVLHLLDDYEPNRVYARTGSVTSVRQLNNVFGKQTWIRAGRDIRGVNFSLRNIRKTDVTLLEAGNDIIGAAGNYGYAITMDGPGSLVLAAGRDIYGGTNTDASGYPKNFSITAIYNDLSLVNHVPGLPAESASITLMAGLNGQKPTYDAFVAAYLDPANVAAMPDYLKQTLSNGTVAPIYLTDVIDSTGGATRFVRRGLVSFIAEMTGETLSPLDAWARFQSLPELTRQVFVRRIYMQELRDAGRNQNEPGADGRPANGGYNRGYSAIATLFPGDAWAGSVKARSLTLNTVREGDIDVLTPGGELQVAALGAVVESGAGIVAQAAGNVNVFARDSVTVNRSRILTFAVPDSDKGSDMMIWSTLGDIDAGRGAKTVRLAKPPEIATDKDGNTSVTELQDLSGSGLGTVGDGDLDLVAPKGTVNAGDAGIRAARDLNIAALRVVNADNIQVGGKSKGVPVVEAPAIGGLSEVSNAGADAARQAAAPAQNRASEQPSVIIVEILGYGGGEGADEDRKQEKRSEYNPGAPIKVMGYGRLGAEDMQGLTEDERRKLTAAR